MERINQKKEELLDEYIRDKKWKLAVKLVESRQKKGDRSDSLLVRKIVILLSSQDEARLEQGKIELVALQQRKPPITDHQALKRLDLFLAGRKDRDGYANNLWAVAGAMSQDEAFLSTWFQLKFEQDRWEAAQKAAQTWQKAFPKHRTPFFLWVLSSHLVSIAAGVTDMHRKVAQGFAYKLLAKSATEVPLRKGGDEDPPSPPRALKKEQDLLLLVEVYTAQLKYSEALAVLEDPRTGYMSHLAKNKWEVARQMIGLYELVGNWKAQWDVCSAILVNARPDIFDKMTDDSAKYDFGELGDDWRIWDGLVTACGQLNADPDAANYTDRTETIIDQFCKDNKSRNAVLANVKLYSVQATAEVNYQKRLFSICQSYFSRYCTKVTCFHDLRPYLPTLDGENQADLLQSMRFSALNRQPTTNANDAAKLHWITAETNVMKFEYHFVASRDDNTQLGDLLPAFVCNCVRLYKSSLQYDFKLPPSDRLPGDDAATLAAMALVRMYRLRHKNPAWACSLLRCVALLEFANNKSPHNYDILLILVRVYMYLGAGSLAVAKWTELSVKNMQNLTVSWMLFTRISTIHPYSVAVMGDDGHMITIDPLEEASNALYWHQRASQLNSNSTGGFRTNGQWMMELDALEAKSALQNGFSRLMLLGESSRIRRLRYPGHRTEEDPEKPVRLSQKVTDTRDSTAFPNYEAHGQPDFWRICPSVEFAGVQVTNEKWLAANLRQALIWDSLHGIGNSIVERTDLEDLLQSFRQQEDAVSSIEEVLFSIGDLIQKSLDQLHPTAANNGLLSASIGQIILQLNSLSSQSAQNPCSADDDSATTRFGIDLHTKYCMLEICQFASSFVKVVQNANRPEFWMKRLLADLHAGYTKLAADVWKSASDLRSKMENSTYLEDLYQKCEGDDEIGNEMKTLLVDQSSLHRIIETLQKSWIDAYEGVIKTKVID